MFLPHIKVNQSPVVNVATTAEPVQVAPVAVVVVDAPPIVSVPPVTPSAGFSDPEPVQATFYSRDGGQSFRFTPSDYGAERFGNCESCSARRHGGYWLETKQERFDDEDGKHWASRGTRFLCLSCTLIAQRGLLTIEPAEPVTPSAVFSEVAPVVAQEEPGTQVPAGNVHNVDSDDSFDDFIQRENAVQSFAKSLEACRVATLQGWTYRIEPQESGNGFQIVVNDPTGNVQTIVSGIYGFGFDTFGRTLDYAVQRMRAAFVCEPETMPNGCQIERRFHKRRECWVFVVTMSEPLSGSRFTTQEGQAKKLGGWYGREYKPEFQRGGFIFLERRAADRFARDFVPAGKVATMRRSGADVPESPPVTPSAGFSEASDAPTFGDRVQTPDGQTGIMRGSGGIGSDRVGLVDDSGQLKTWVNRSELTKVEAAQNKSANNAALINRLSVAGGLEKLADGMQKTIAEKLRPMTQNYTHKRGREYAGRVHDGENMQRCQEALRALASHWRADTVPEILRALKTKSAIQPLVSEKWQEPGSRGYEGPEVFHHNTAQAVALRQLVAQSRSADAVAQTEVLAKRKEIEAAENTLRFADIPGFFPTPPALCERMIEAAELPDTPSGDFSILEPSAGSGSIIDAILSEVPAMAGRIDAHEAAHGCCNVLTAKGHRHEQRDFLQVPEKHGTYDRILMNPPFENLQDVDHVRHAFSLLKDGGRLVAIMSESAFHPSPSRQKVAAFQYWLNEVGAESTPIRDAFKDATAFRNTGVAVRLVVIDKNE